MRLRALTAAVLLTATAACSAGVRTRAVTPVRVDTETIAYAAKTEVAIRRGDGSARRLAPVAADGGAFGLRWAPDRSALAWLEVEGRAVRTAEYDFAGATLRRADLVPLLPDDDDTAPAYLAYGDGGTLMAFGGRTLTVYIRTATALAARTVPVTGADGARLFGTGTAGGALLVYSDEQASHFGGPSVIYALRADGVLTRLFGDADDDPEGVVRNAPVGSLTTRPDGTEIAYVTGTEVSGCDAFLSIETRPVPGWRPATPVPLPHPPAGMQWRIASLTYGADGRLYAVLAPSPPKCAPGGTPALYTLRLGGWTAGERDVSWGAASAGGTIAVMGAKETGPDAPVPAPAPLKVTDPVTGKLVVVADAVTEAAWAPAP
jgi:hypothetical protein